MSSYQLAKKIKEIDPGIPVGLITGWTVATPKEKIATPSSTGERMMVL